MIRQSIVLLHGFASSSRSAKAGYLEERIQAYPDVEFQAIDFNPTPEDFEQMTITGMIERLRGFLYGRDWGELHLIGSSMGALVGLHYARRFGGITRLLLLAPALKYDGLLSEPEIRQWKERGYVSVHHFDFGREIPLKYAMHQDGQQYSELVPPPGPVMIIHGRYDDVVPIIGSRQYRDAHPDQVILHEVDSDHRLNDKLDFIWNQVTSFLLGKAEKEDIGRGSQAVK